MKRRKQSPIRIEGDLAFVALTKGYETVIDAADVSTVSGFSWYAKLDKRRDGSIRAVYAYRSAGGTGGRKIYMHRVIAATPSGTHTDHIDGDGLNNRRSNLRHASPSENIRNKRTPVNNSSGVKGVHWCKKSNKWKAQIKVGNEQIYLGTHSKINDAAAAYAKASLALFGEFARHE